MGKGIYEIFHKNARIQRRIIDEKNFTYRILIKIIAPYLKELKSKKSGQVYILDIGCGVGTIDFFLASQGFNVVGIDISSNAITTANLTASHLGLGKKAVFKNINFLKESLKKKFDFVIFNEVIEHLVNDALAIKKIFNLLKKRGLVYISTPSKKAPLHRLGLTRRFDQEVGHLRRYEIEELEELVKGGGFIVLKKGKTEGILRNFLFINSLGKKFIRFFKFFISDIITYIDNKMLILFGGSNIYILAQKP